MPTKATSLAHTVNALIKESEALAAEKEVTITQHSLLDASKTVMVKSVNGSLYHSLKDSLTASLASAPRGGAIAIKVFPRKGKACIIVSDDGAHASDKRIQKICEDAEKRGVDLKISRVDGRGTNYLFTCEIHATKPRI